MDTINLGRQDQCTCINYSKDLRPDSLHWQYAVNRLTQDLFSSTGVGLPSPHNYLAHWEGGSSLSSSAGCRIHRVSYAFNSDPFASQDVFSYRSERSEHILFRLTHCLIGLPVNVLRLDQGVFAVQPSSTTQEQGNNHKEGYSITHWIRHLEGPTPLIPYSYTMGVRYTNLKRGDVMVRGAIPLWCQSLLLCECYRAWPPIKPGDTRCGLLPFAPHLPLTFMAISDKTDKIDDPELLLWYERFAMDTSDHEFYGQKIEDSPEWQMARLEILENAVLCNISSDDAQAITSMAMAWSNQQQQQGSSRV